MSSLRRCWRFRKISESTCHSNSGLCSRNRHHPGMPLLSHFTNVLVMLIVFGARIPHSVLAYPTATEDVVMIVICQPVVGYAEFNRPLKAKAIPLRVSAARGVILSLRITSSPVRCRFWCCLSVLGSTIFWGSGVTANRRRFGTCDVSGCLHSFAKVSVVLFVLTRSYCVFVYSFGKWARSPCLCFFLK